MSFNYHKKNGEGSSDSFWTSYSDLFLGLSCIFLLLYVVSSMRQGADSIKQQVVSEQLAMEVNDLKNQLKAYEDIKNQYMQDQATTSEKNEYNELVDKLSLLQEENQSENDKLKRQLLENHKKEQSLNKYQQMVRNMLNANKLAKTKLITREDVIEEKSQVIKEKDQQVDELEQEVESNQQKIAAGERQIQDAKKQLSSNLDKLQKAFKENKITRVILEKRMAQANTENQDKLKAIRQEKMRAETDLAGINQKLQEVNTNLNLTKVQLERKAGEAAQLQGQLETTTAESAAKLSSLKTGFEAQQARDKAAFDNELGKLKLTTAEKEKRSQAFRLAALQKEQDMSKQMSGLQGQLEQKTGEAAQLKGRLTETANEAASKINSLKAGYAAQQSRDKAAFEGELGKMKLSAAEKERRGEAYRLAALQKENAMNKQMSGLQGQLEKARAEIEARKSVAKDIQKSFSKAGIKAEVDIDTGEVLLDFGNSYFDNGSAQLKNEMKTVIERAVPLYAQSLLGNEKISDKVSAVEIIGFASPTYKGRFVDPASNSKKDQDALKYNMDLSYARAKSIFNYIVDNQKNQSPSQKNLMSLMKVSGRSFLEVSKVQKNVTPENFCKVNDCKKAQRVVIRFSMDSK